MKKLLLSFLLCLPAIAIQAQDVDFKISGTVAQDIDNLNVIANNDRQSMTGVSVKDGKFTITGTKPLNTLITMSFGRNSISFINDGTPIEFDLTNNTFSGSDLNKKIFDYDRQLDEKYADKIKALYAEYEALTKDESEDAQAKMQDVEKRFNEVSDAMSADEMKIVKENKDNFIPIVYISQLIYDFDYEEMKELLESDAPYLNHPIMDRVKMQFAAYEKRMPGKMFTDLTMNDPDNNPRQFSEWCGKGNYVLVDFWASWCGPCRNEMPNVVENYKKYHSAGFDILGVSFDNKDDAWKGAIKSLGMEWPQLSDLKGWKSEGASAYGITAIPANVLLDKEGKIIAIDLRGNDLGNKLKEIYGF